MHALLTRRRNLFVSAESIRKGVPLRAVLRNKATTSLHNIRPPGPSKAGGSGALVSMPLCLLVNIDTAGNLAGQSSEPKVIFG